MTERRNAYYIRAVDFYRLFCLSKTGMKTIFQVVKFVPVFFLITENLTDYCIGRERCKYIVYIPLAENRKAGSTQQLSCTPCSAPPSNVTWAVIDMQVRAAFNYGNRLDGARPAFVACDFLRATHGDRTMCFLATVTPRLTTAKKLHSSWAT